MEDRGWSVHVCDAATGAEYLRFDVFEGDPHYHYIHPGDHHFVVPFDRAASGDMTEWAIECLRRRLPEMLEHAGASDLAARVDRAQLEAAIPELRAALSG